MSKIFKALKVLIVTLVVILFVAMLGLAIFIYFFDLNKYKGQISDIVEKQIGREFKIDGDAKLGFSLIPTLELNNVRLANAKWSKNQNMLELERLDVKVSVLPLLKKEINIDRIILVKPRIFLEVNKDGKANWDFDLNKPIVAENPAPVENNVKAEPSTNNVAAEAVIVSESGQAIPINGFTARDIHIEDGWVEMNNYQTKSDLKLQINNIQLSAETQESDISLLFDIVFNDESIKGNAKAGSLKTLLEAYEPYPVELNVKAYGATAEIDGSVIEPLGDNIHYIMNVMAENPKGNFGAPKVKAKTVVDGNLKKVKVDIQSLDVEGNIITGNIVADIAGKIPNVVANLKSDLINLETLTQTATVNSSSYSFVSEVYASELVPDTPIPYEMLEMANAAVNVDIKSLIVNKDIKLDGVSLNAKLTNGVLDVSPLVIKAGKGSINIDVNMNAKNKSLAAKIKSKDLVVQELYRPLGVKSGKNFYIREGGQTLVDIDVKSSGATARTVVNGLIGQSIIVVNKSEITSGELQLLSGSLFKNIMNLLKINTKDSVNQTLNCAVVRTDFAGGKATFPNGIGIDASKMKLSSDGYINLVNDKISFSIKPFSGKGTDVNITQIASSLLKVTGTLTNPSVGIDETQAAKAVVGLAVNAPIYAGSAILLDAASAPCYSALENTTYSNMFEKPEGMAASGQDAYKNVEGAVKDSVKATTDTLKDSAKDIKDSAKDLLGVFGKRK